MSKPITTSITGEMTTALPAENTGKWYPMVVKVKLPAKAERPAHRRTIPTNAQNNSFFMVASFGSLCGRFFNNYTQLLFCQHWADLSQGKKITISHPFYRRDMLFF
jgi:hypothetical protein